MVARAALAALALSACSGGGGARFTDAGSTTPPSSVPATTAPPVPVTEVGGECTGVGQVAGVGEVTWVARGRLLARPAGAAGAPRCVAMVTVPGALEWSGGADRVLLGREALGPDTRRQPVAAAHGARLARWSRPTGTSVLVVDGAGRLRKVGQEAPDGKEISFLERHEETIYHPAGRSIVSVGEHPGLGYGLYYATNEGTEPRRLVQNEDARRIHSLAWTDSGALLFVAEHGGHTDLHRLELATGRLTTIASRTDGTYSAVVASPFRGGGVAYATGDCASGFGPVQVTRGGRTIDVSATPAARAVPVGWLPDGSLVLHGRTSCAVPEPAPLFLVRDGQVERIDEAAEMVAVRAVLPPPPAPPRSLPSDAPA